jgi:hypothetical protein
VTLPVLANDMDNRAIPLCGRARAGVSRLNRQAVHDMHGTFTYRLQAIGEKTNPGLGHMPNRKHIATLQWEVVHTHAPNLVR